MEKRACKIGSIIRQLKVLVLGPWIQGVRRERRPGPGRLAVTLSLASEVVLILWLAAAEAVPWTMAVTLALVVGFVLVVALIGTSGKGPGRRSWPVGAVLGLAVAIDITMVAFLTFVLLLLLFQGAIAGKGFLPFLIVPLIMAYAIFLDVGLPLFLALALVLIMGTGVLMDSGPVAFLAVPLVMAIGVGVVLFQAISPDPSRGLRRLPGDARRPRRERPPY